ncbi:unnamed protein product [Leuciscus chuanchicus]
MSQLSKLVRASFPSLTAHTHSCSLAASWGVCFGVHFRRMGVPVTGGRFPVVPLGLLVGFCLDTSLRASGVCSNKSNTHTHTRCRGVGRTQGYPLSVLPRDPNAESLSYVGVDGL